METLEFIDGSSLTTYGIVYDVEWRFGPAPQTKWSSRETVNDVQDWEYGSDARPDSTFIYDFYVLENLSCQLILSADLLYGTNAFKACARYFHESIDSLEEPQLDDADVFVMRKRRETLWEVVSNIFFKSGTTGQFFKYDSVVFYF
jgi:hypothetical protein